MLLPGIENLFAWDKVSFYKTTTSKAKYIIRVGSCWFSSGENISLYGPNPYLNDAYLFSIISRTTKINKSEHKSFRICKLQRRK